MKWFEVFGGRKFFGFVSLLLTTLVLAKLGAPGEAYIAISVSYAALAGANAVVTKLLSLMPMWRRNRSRILCCVSARTLSASPPTRRR